MTLAITKLRSLLLQILTVKKSSRKTLQTRLVLIFSLLAALPAIIMTVLSAFLFHYGVQAWFSDRIQSAIHNASGVAESYLDEHKQSIVADSQLMANDLVQQGALASRSAQDAAEFDAYLQQLSFLHDLQEAIVFDTKGNIFGRTSLTYSLEFKTVPTYALRMASEGETVVVTAPSGEAVRALVKLSPDEPVYLYAGRIIDPKLLTYLQETKEASDSYTQMLDHYKAVQLSITIIFIVVALLLVLLAIWLGVVLARQIVQPVRYMLGATQMIKVGDYSMRLPTDHSLTEFQALAQGYNSMADHIQRQRSALLETNEKLDQRRKLTENVLEGVSSGIIGVDEQGVVKFSNHVAQQMLGAALDDGLDGNSLADRAPSLQQALKDSAGSSTPIELPYKHPIKGNCIYLIRSTQAALNDGQGAIITLEDVTILQKAQKKAAWAGVAQRLAHEIKNPLTPIQLSAERLQRKYLPQIIDQPDRFSQCVDTIIKQVDDIGAMVSSFSSFARMPDPNIARGQDVLKLIDDCVFIQKQAYPNITMTVDNQSGADTIADFDPQQMRQVFTNLLQNAAEAVNDSHADNMTGQVYVGVFDHALSIFIADNGAGFPIDVPADSLLEPYATHKQGGTGLGLSIVKNIIESHGCDIILGLQAIEAHLDDAQIAEIKPHILGGASILIRLHK